MAKPQEVADLVYTSVDEASFITGTDFPIDGGLLNSMEIKIKYEAHYNWKSGNLEKTGLSTDNGQKLDILPLVQIMTKSFLVRKGQKD